MVGEDVVAGKRTNNGSCLSPPFAAEQTRIADALARELTGERWEQYRGLTPVYLLKTGAGAVLRSVPITFMAPIFACCARRRPAPN